MIRSGRCKNEFGKTCNFISIDMASAKHKTRVIDILEFVHPISGDYLYSLKAKWTQDKFHPSMNLSEKDIVSLAKAFGKLARKIEKRAERIALTNSS